MKGLARLSGYSVGLRIARVLLGLISAALFTRLMPVREYGIYAYVLAIAGILAVPGEGGMPNLVMREIARARAENDLPVVRGMILFANMTVIVLTAAVAVVAAVVLILPLPIPATLDAPLAAAIPALLLGALANTRAGILRALDVPILSQVPEQIVRPAALILFGLSMSLIFPLNARNATLAFALASACSFVLGSVLLYRSFRDKVGRGPATLRTRAWLAALLPFTAIAGLQLALVQISTLILGLFASPVEVATIRVATLVSDFAMLSTMAINALVAPALAAHQHRGERAEIETLIARVNRINLAFATLVFAGIAICGPLVLPLVFGDHYRVAWLPACILALGHVFSVPLGYVHTIANMAGEERLTVTTSLGGLALSLLLSILLCPSLGAIGAAIAASVTAIIWRVLLAWRVYRRLGIRAWTLAT